ncbi:MAG: hypothetical protein JXQ69_02975 [Paludibacteraceae bacterium]|nr:hypothetical protein [Paludibacteraceae bacterium]MBN2787266.1 hypothetical protein [Paludibacteraceae bacterium]
MTTQKTKKENPFWSLAFNIIIPILVLNKLGKFIEVGPVVTLCVALAFPLIYGVSDWFKKKKANFISILGFAGIFLTGIIGVFELPTEWIAFKEASIPFIIGVAILVTIKTPFPLVKKLLYSPEIMDVEKIDAILIEKNAKERFDKILVNSSYLLSFSFFLSSVLNFVLARIIMHSPSGTPAFNDEYSKMLGLSWPVIVVPSMIVMAFILWYLFSSLTKITGLKFEEMFNVEDK